MKLLFAHDHKFGLDSTGLVYSDGKLAYSVWSRYRCHFDELIVVGRSYLLSATEVESMDLSSGTNVSFFFGPNLSSPAAHLMKRRAAQKTLRKLVSDVDAVVARLPSELGLLAINEARKAGLPYVVEVVTCPWDALMNHGGWLGKVYAPIMTTRMKSAVKKAPFCLYVTKEFLQRRYPNTSGVAVACSDVEILPSGDDVLQRRLDIVSEPSSVVTLGLIGTLRTRFKGIQTVFEALSLIRDNLPAVQFRILGSGDSEPWKEEAKKFGVDDLVIFDGILSGGDPVLSWLDNVDVYLQPSFQEGLPRALIEAMSRGCPALASTCAGIPELLDAGCLIKSGDAKHLGELIKKAIGDAEWQKAQAHRNWKESHQYSKDILEARRHDFWAQFADHARSMKPSKSHTGNFGEK